MPIFWEFKRPKGWPYGLGEQIFKSILYTTTTVLLLITHRAVCLWPTKPLYILGRQSTRQEKRNGRQNLGLAKVKSKSIFDKVCKPNPLIDWRKTRVWQNGHLSFVRLQEILRQKIPRTSSHIVIKQRIF